MTDQPWAGDACSLVDAYRRGEHSPLDELDATLAAIDASELNAFSYLDVDAARAAARGADVTLPFGGVPIPIKETDSVAGWPDTEASLPFKDRIADHDSTKVTRLRGAGAVLVGQTTASEFAGINVTYTKLHGATRNPWSLDRTPGGSSGGAAAAVAGGLVTIASGGDGGGSIRIPAGFTGTLGLKNTYGRIPKGPRNYLGNVTAVPGCLARSVRDTARWLDITNGFDPRDPLSLPRVEGWEAGLGTYDLRGKRVAIAPDLGAAVVHPALVAAVQQHGEQLARDAGLQIVDHPVKLPELSFEWALAGLSEIRHDLGDLYPDCADDLTLEIAFGLKIAEKAYNLQSRVRIEASRIALNEAMADLFDHVDFVIASTNPDVAFAAEGPMRTRVGDVDTGPGNNGALTIPSNTYGNPAISIPIGEHDGLPIGLQVLAPHHREAWLLDLALLVERERPWPLVAPAAPR
ncbi:MAG TPA: amidase [Acidimicrobiia bacterium]|nr:amidase [Acidimicrobiia bacterium]